MFVHCPNCHTDVRQGVRFCPHCGAIFAHSVIRCFHCGNSITQGRGFCGQCGKAVSQAICVQCGRINQAQAKYCCQCGAPLAGVDITHPFGTGKMPSGQWLQKRYHISRKIAQGGMAAVYAAVDTGRSSTEVAIKEFSFTAVQSLSPSQQQDVIKGFRREFEILCRLKHPNLITAFDYFEENSRQYFVMEYLKGHTLDFILESLSPGQFLPVGRVLRWAEQLCDVFSFLHAENPPIIYRDLKPGNVMCLDNSDKLVLFDFGIARYHKPGQKGDTLKFGTPGYAPPEFYSAQQSNQTSDVYAMGVLLHQLFTNFDPTSSPFQLPPIHSINKSVPSKVEDAIMRALEQDVRKRTKTIIELMQDLFGAAVKPAWKQTPAVVIAPPVRPYPQYTPISIQAPVQQSSSPPIKVPASNIQAIVFSPPALVFPLTKKGKIVSNKIQVTSAPGSVGRVMVSQNWIMPDKFELSSNDILTIKIDTKNLSTTRWESPKNSRIYKLPNFIRYWLLAHIHQLVPGNGKYTSLVSLDYGLVGVASFPVSIELEPASYRLALGWGLVFLLIMLEILFILSPLALLFTS